MYVTYTRIYGWSDYGGESSYQPRYRLENMMWMTLLVYDYIIPARNEPLKKYDVTLTAHYQKTISVCAESAEQAKAKTEIILFDTDLINFTDDLKHNFEKEYSDLGTPYVQ